MNWQSARLVCHPATPAPDIDAVTVELSQHRGSLQLGYRIYGDIGKLRVPEQRMPARSDGLWQHSCMELFIADVDGPGYQEFNFSPSGEWAHYAFSDYRTALPDPADTAVPGIECTSRDKLLTVTVSLRQAIPLPRTLGLAAVLEGRDGRLSYWALAHPESQPDFHHADAFSLQLE